MRIFSNAGVLTFQGSCGTKSLSLLDVVTEMSDSKSFRVCGETIACTELERRIQLAINAEFIEFIEFESEGILVS